MGQDGLIIPWARFYFYNVSSQKGLSNPDVVTVHIGEYDGNILGFLWGNHGPVDHDTHR